MYVTEHVPLVKVHGDPVNVPVLPLVNATVPVGTLAVPGELSATVTLHVTATPTLPVAGHVTVVVVALLLIVMLDVPLLVACVASPL